MYPQYPSIKQKLFMNSPNHSKAFKWIVGKESAHSERVRVFCLQTFLSFLQNKKPRVDFKSLNSFQNLNPENAHRLPHPS